MIEINPLSPSYPIKKLKNTVRDQKKQAKQDQTTQSQKEKEEQISNDRTEQKIDEIV